MASPVTLAVTSTPALKWSGRLVWLASLVLTMLVLKNAWTAYDYRQSLTALRCDAPIHEFGTAFSGQDILHTFHVTNVSRKMIRIAQVTAECGCTTISTDLVDRSIAAQESFDVPVKLSLSGAQKGDLDKKVLIRFDDDPARKMTLRIKGKVEQRWSWTPPTVIFDDVSAEEASIQTLTVRLHPQAPEDVLEQIVTSKPLSAEIVGESSDEHGKLWRVRVMTAPPLSIGRQQGALYLKTSSSQSLSTSIPVIILATATPGSS